MMTINMHGCTDVKLVRHSPENANCITLRVEREGGEQSVDLALFNLPPHVTDALIAALARDQGVIKTVAAAGV